MRPSEGETSIATSHLGVQLEQLKSWVQLLSQDASRVPVGARKVQQIEQGVHDGADDDGNIWERVGN